MGITEEEFDTQGVQVFGNVADKIARRRRYRLLLLTEDLQGIAEKRESARQYLIQHHADTVPVRGRS